MRTFRIYSFNNFLIYHTANFKNYCLMYSIIQKRKGGKKRQRETERGRKGEREGRGEKKKEKETDIPIPETIRVFKLEQKVKAEAKVIHGVLKP